MLQAPGTCDLFSHLDQYSILCNEQHGFRHKRSCETQLILTIYDLARNLDCGLQTDVIFLTSQKLLIKWIININFCCTN